jgi:hypothetical protein
MKLEDSVESLYYKSEAMRLFSCTNSAVNDRVQTVLSSPEAYLVTVSDYFQAYQLNNAASSSNSVFSDALNKKVTEDWSKNFKVA